MTSFENTVVFLFLLFNFSVKAQLPETDIFLYEIKKTATTVILHKGENITNRAGYDNQPFFMPDNKTILFVSIKEDKQADIYKYEIKSKKITPLTHTTTSEYSPVLSPDGKSISAVVVETDSTQRIWSVKPDGSSQSLLTEQEDSIGYYTWLNNDTLLFYKLSDPHSLHAYSLSQHKDVWLADNITRSFKACDKNTFFYVLKEKDKNTVRHYDIRIKKSSEYAVAKAENEDFIWDKTLGLVKSEGAKLLRYKPEIKTWLEIADFSGAGVAKITRFAFSANGRYLAFVSNK